MKLLEDIPEGKITCNNIENLDSLPFPDWSIYDYRKTRQSPFLKLNPVVSIQASRRCPFKCDYCPYIIDGNNFNQRSVFNVIDEIVYLKSKYGVRSLIFRDPIFSYKQKWVMELSKNMIEKKMNVHWGIETRVDFLTEELVDIMYKAGLRAIKIGIESTDREMLKHHKRHAPKTDHLIKIVKHAESKGIHILALYVLGLPEDDVRSIQSTIKFAKKLNTSIASFTICSPIPGTAFFDEYHEKITVMNQNKWDNFHPALELVNLKKEELTKMHRNALITYYYRPSYLIKHFRNLF